MTRDEVKTLLATMLTFFPNFKVENKSFTVNAWTLMLQNYDASMINKSLQNYVMSSNSAFPPSMPQLISGIKDMEKLSQPPTLQASEAWAMVRKAISRGNYHSQEDFDSMPVAVQRAVGSAQRIFIMAGDPNYDEGVESSNFMRMYDRITKDEEHRNDLQIAMAQPLQIGVNNEI